MAPNMYCQVCNVDNLPGTYCGACGSALLVRPAVCQSCGNARLSGKFCDQCGTPFENYCEKCGSLTPKTSLCEACGQELEESQPSRTEIENQKSRVTSAPMTLPESTLVPVRKNRLAITGLGFGIASVFLWEFSIFPLVAVVVSSIGLSKALKLKSEGNAKPNTGMAIAGLVLGFLYIIVWFAYNSGFMNGYVR